MGLWMSDVPNKEEHGNNKEEKHDINAAINHMSSV